MRISRLLLALVINLLVGALAYGESDGIHSVRTLARQTSIIVVARASTEDVDQRPLSISLSIERTIKGNLNTGATISVGNVRISSLCPPPRPGQIVTAIWFLDRGNDGSYLFTTTPKNQSCTPFENQFEMPSGTPPVEWQASASASPEDKLAYEIGWSFESHNGKGPYAALENPWILDGASSATEDYIYSRLAASPDQNVKLFGTLGLIRKADPKMMSNLGSIAAQMTQVAPLTALRINGKEQALRLSGSSGENANATMTASAIGSIVDPEKNTVTSLRNIMMQTSLPISMRYAASRALANIHTPLAATYLAPFLYSNDISLRDSAISGIACLANGVPILDPKKKNGGMDINQDSEFKDNETLQHFVNGSHTIEQNADFYLTFWRTWWNSHGIAVQALADKQ